MQILTNSYLDPQYKTSWIIHNLQTVKNVKLFQQYMAKAEEMKYAQLHTTEQDMFMCYNDVHLVQNILEHGLQPKPTGFNFLGNSEMGVNLCRHADIQLKVAEITGQNECYLVVYKVLPGRSLLVCPSQDNKWLTLSKHFDSHISRLVINRSLSIEKQFVRSQMFCYEYLNGRLSSSPRQILPYVVIFYKRATQPLIMAPTVNVLSQRTRAIQQSALLQLFQQQYHQTHIRGVCYSQPRLPSVNHFGTQHPEELPFPVAPVTFQGNMLCRGNGGWQMSAGHAPSIDRTPHAFMNISKVPCPIHQVTHKMQPPYASNMLSSTCQKNAHLNNYQSYLASSAAKPLAMPQKQDNWHSNAFLCASAASRHLTQWAVPQLLPVRNQTNCSRASENKQPEDTLGMLLPVSIHQKESSSGKVTAESGPLSGFSHQLMGTQIPTTTVMSVDCQTFDDGNIKPDKAVRLVHGTKHSSLREVTNDTAVKYTKHYFDKECCDTAGDAREQTVTEIKFEELHLCSALPIDLQEPALTSEAKCGSDFFKGESIPSGTRMTQVSCDVGQQNLDKLFTGHDAMHTLDNAEKTMLVDGIIKEKTDLHSFDQEEHCRSNQCIIRKKLLLNSRTAVSLSRAEEDDTLPDLPSINDLEQTNEFPSQNRNIQSTFTAARLTKGRSNKFLYKHFSWKKTLKRAARKKRFLHFIKSSTTQYPAVQRTVFHFCRNGSIKMFCDFTDPSVQEEREDHYKVTPKLHLLLNELSSLEVESLMKGVDENILDIELVSKDITCLTYGQGNISDELCAVSSDADDHLNYDK